MHANIHEYYRYRNAYVTRYNEEELARIFKESAEKYDKKEDGRFVVSFRCSSEGLANSVLSRFMQGGVHSVIDKARAMLGKKEKAASALLKGSVSWLTKPVNCVVYVLFEEEQDARQ